MGLLSEVSFPLGLVLGWEGSVGIVVKDGGPVGVKGALGSQVAYDEPCGGLDVNDILGGLGQHGRGCGMSCIEGVESFLA